MGDDARQAAPPAAAQPGGRATDPELAPGRGLGRGAEGGPSLQAQLRFLFQMLIVSGLALTLVLTGWLAWMLAASAPTIDRLRTASSTVLMIDMQAQNEQSDLRAYLATGDGSYLRSYQQGSGSLPVAVSSLDSQAAGTPAGRLVAFEVALQQWRTQWADLVANGVLTAGASVGTAADPQRLEISYAQGATLFARYSTAEGSLYASLQNQLTTARNIQRYATMISAGIGLLIALGTAALGVRRQLQLRRSVAGPMRDIGHGLGALMRGDYDNVAITPGGPAELYGMSTLVAALAKRLAARRRETEAAARRETERLARTDVILAVAREVAGSLNLRYVLEAVATAAASLCGARRARLWLVETPGAPMLLSFDTDYGRAGIREPAELVLGTGPAGRAAKYGRPALGEGAEVREGVPVVAVPLIVGARVVGALECAGGEPREMSEEILASLETLATHAAAAIEASRLHQAAEEMSVTDPLTGLANRRQLDRDLPTEVDRAARYGRPLTVLFLDLDHFKMLNDRYGHSYGDLVLQQVGQALAGELRTVDKAYRLGGEEFVVMSPESTLEEGRARAERLREMVARATAQTGTSAGVTASFGVATLPEHGVTGPALLAAADAALYAAKAAGRNQVVVATAPADGTEPMAGLAYALPPVVGRPSRQLEPPPDIPFQVDREAAVRSVEAELGAEVDAALEHVDD